MSRKYGYMTALLIIVNKKRTVIVRFLERINLMQKRNERKRNI